MWLKKYNTLPEGLPPLNSSPLEDDTSWLKKYANGGRVGDPPPRKLNPNFKPKPMGYYNTLKQPEVSESTGTINPYIIDEEETQLIQKNIKEKGDLIETVKRVNPEATHYQAVKNAESILHSTNREQETAREWTPEEKAQGYETRRTGDISGAGDYWQRAKDIIWNPIDAFTYAMDSRVDMPLGLTQYKELQRKGLMPDDQVSSNAMMNTAGIASYAIPGLGLIAEGKDLYENSSAFLEDPTLDNAAWLALGGAGAKATWADQKLYGRFARNKFNNSEVGNTIKDGVVKTTDKVGQATGGKDNWIRPDANKLAQEFEVEHELKKLGAFSSKEDFMKAVEKAKVEAVPKGSGVVVENRVATGSREGIINMNKGYRSWPEFRNEGTIDAIYDGMRNNKPMELPIILEYPDGKRRMFSGNTRLDIAEQVGKEPKALIVKVPETPSGKSYPKSEIDWGKWNKEIPNDKALMQEYGAIEKASKADGTWLKNSDGSRSLLPDGRPANPQQWVQAQSKDWVKAYGKKGFEGTEGTFMGRGRIYNKGVEGNISEYLRPKTHEYADRSLMSNPDGNMMWYYSHNMGSGRYKDMTFDDLFNEYKFTKNKIDNWDTMGDDVGIGIHQLVLPKDKNTLRIDGKGKSWSELEDKEKYDKIIALDPTVSNRYPEGKYSTDLVAEYLENPLNTRYKRAVVENVDDGGLGDVIINKQTKGNYHKSLWGNNGKWDLTNPSIYKAMMPALMGAGAIGSQTIPSKEESKNHKTGGWLKNY